MSSTPFVVSYNAQDALGNAAVPVMRLVNVYNQSSRATYCSSRGEQLLHTGRHSHKNLGKSLQNQFCITQAAVGSVAVPAVQLVSVYNHFSSKSCCSSTGESLLHVTSFAVNATVPAGRLVSMYKKCCIMSRCLSHCYNPCCAACQGVQPVSTRVLLLKHRCVPTTHS